MKLSIKSQDPLRILETTKGVLETAQFVSIAKKNIPQIADQVSRQLKKGLEDLGAGFHLSNSFKDNVQLTFIEDVVNFCFWSDFGVPRWQVEFPKGQVTEGGWFGLQKCFERALFERIPILEAKYLAEITLAQTKDFFRSSNDQSIPLLEERRNNFQEAGKVLLDKYDGEFINALEKSGGDAIELVKLVFSDFPSFYDVANLEGKEIYFLKRAQIVANDIFYLSAQSSGAHLRKIDELTAFADYKIPQILRALGVVSYNDDLARKIDAGIYIDKNSREEIEIRSAMVWGVELIRQASNEKYTAAQIDNALWLLSQNKHDMAPYHRTKTIFY